MRQRQKDEGQALTPATNWMKLKNGTHISGGKNCCAKTVYTGDVIHVICRDQSRHFML